MATIVINDLTESTELDRSAMLAIAGGARFRAGATAVVRPAAPKVRLFELAPATARQPAARPPAR
ncbi:hypothetical protein [Massilia niabensis]|uniref:Uncharacterized protein n=1 Tax=Massilia niabensis TaxID=544910 RepID=A0ABW0L4L0_9BURK